MEEFEIENELYGKTLTNFDEKLKQAVFLTKFTAITAKKILLVSRLSGVNPKDLLDGVEGWIDKLEGEEINAQKS